jgi:hypothetical protein
MSKELVTDELWEIIEPLLPPEPPKPRGGRHRVEDRAALADIIFVLKSSVLWEMLSQLHTVRFCNSLLETPDPPVDLYATHTARRSMPVSSKREGAFFRGMRRFSKAWVVRRGYALGGGARFSVMCSTN